LEKQPTARYASAAELAEDLDNYLNCRAIKAHPPSWLEKLASHIARRPSDVVMAAWRATTISTAVSVCICHLLMFWLVLRVEQSEWLVRLCLVLNLVVIWTLFAVFYLRHLRGIGDDVRVRTVLWLGHTFAFVVLWLAAGAPGNEGLWEVVYPGWATLYGLSYFIVGGLVWGRFFAISFAWFLTALAMTASPGWARPLEYLALYGVHMSLVLWGMRRPRDSDQGAQPALPTRAKSA
jgi:hypothetical protein